jgi:hypothetical protein
MPDTTPISPAEAFDDGSRQAAARALVKLTADYRLAANAGPPPEPGSLGDAVSRLSQLQNDKEWAGKLLAGDGAATREFHQLSEIIAAKGDTVDGIMAGADGLSNTAVNGVPAPATVAREIPALREFLNDNEIAELLRGNHVASPAEIAAVKRLRAARHGNAEWVQRFLKGDPECVRESRLCSIVLATQQGAA